MPVTAKLSRKFYETFGDDVANELVDWFNKVDATYRSDLRELNDLNFARFRAEMEAGFTRFDARLDQRTAELKSYFDARIEHALPALGLDRRFAQIDDRFAPIDNRFAQVDDRFAQIDQRFAQVDERFAKLQAEMETGFERLRTEIAKQGTDTVKWMFLFWVGMVATIFVTRLM